jgi:hypothetical protein
LRREIVQLEEKQNHTELAKKQEMSDGKGEKAQLDYLDFAILHYDKRIKDMVQECTKADQSVEQHLSTIKDITTKKESLMQLWHLAKKYPMVREEVCHMHTHCHANTPKKDRVWTEYTTSDGIYIMFKGSKISLDTVFSDAHYGAMGGPGRLEKQTVHDKVREMYMKYYMACEKASQDGTALPKIPDPIITSVTYCGN